MFLVGAMQDVQQLRLTGQDVAFSEQMSPYMPFSMCSASTPACTGLQPSSQRPPKGRSPGLPATSAHPRPAPTRPAPAHQASATRPRVWCPSPSSTPTMWIRLARLKCARRCERNRARLIVSWCDLRHEWSMQLVSKLDDHFECVTDACPSCSALQFPVRQLNSSKKLVMEFVDGEVRTPAHTHTRTSALRWQPLFASPLDPCIVFPLLFPLLCFPALGCII